MPLLEVSTTFITSNFKNDFVGSPKDNARVEGNAIGKSQAAQSVDINVSKLESELFLARRQLETSENHRKHLTEMNQELKDENDTLVREIQDTFDDMDEVLRENSYLRDDLDRLEKLHSEVKVERDEHLETIQAQNDTFFSDFLPKEEVDELVQRARLEERSRISLMFGERHIMQHAIEQLQMQKEDLEHEVERLQKLFLMQDNSGKKTVISHAEIKAKSSLLSSRRSTLTKAFSDSSVQTDNNKTICLEKILGVHDDDNDENDEDASPSVLGRASFMRQACLSVSGESGLLTFGSGEAGSSSAVTASSSARKARRNSRHSSFCSSSIDDNGFESVRKASITSVSAIYKAGYDVAEKYCESQSLFDANIKPTSLSRNVSELTSAGIMSDSSCISASVSDDLPSSQRRRGRRSSADMDLQELLLGCTLASKREFSRRRSSGVAGLSGSSSHLSIASLLQSTSELDNNGCGEDRSATFQQGTIYPKHENEIVGATRQFRGYLAPLVEARGASVSQRTCGSETLNDMDEPEDIGSGLSWKGFEEKYSCKAGNSSDTRNRGRSALSKCVAKHLHDSKLSPSSLQTSNDIKNALMKRRGMVREMRAHRCGQGNTKN